MVKTEKEQPLVSVAIVTYNQKEFLTECIESVLSQDYTNIELVIADDGSTDGTDTMLRYYENKYPGKFIVKLAEKNQGITKNCNLAHFECSGKYIAWTGGDDIMLPGKIRKQVEFMERNPECNICYHNVEIFESETNRVLGYFNTSSNAYEGGIATAIKFGTFNCASSNMVRKKNTPANGFDERIPIASDWLYWVECLNNRGTINYINEILGKYRRHSKSVTSSSSKTTYLNFLDHFNSLSIILFKYPQYGKEVMYRFATVYRDSRHLNNESYYTFLIMSLKMHLNYKAFIMLFVALGTFGYKKI